MTAVTRSYVDGVFRVMVPLRTCSEANAREHWAKKAARVKSQRAMMALVLGPCPACWSPSHVLLTRIAPRELDTDNLQSSFKAIRDEIARWIGVDDGDKRVVWLCTQAPGEYAVAVEVW